MQATTMITKLPRQSVNRWLNLLVVTMFAAAAWTSAHAQSPGAPPMPGDRPDDDKGDTPSITDSDDFIDDLDVDEAIHTERGLSEGDADDETLPSLYLLPMRGQMGTDIHPDAYRDVVDDIRQHDPDYLVLVLHSRDELDEFFMDVPVEEQSIPLMDHYRELVSFFRRELRDIPQILWIEDSVGFSSMIALAWDQIYMKPDARLGGLEAVIDRTGVMGWRDEDVRAKMLSAMLADAISYAEFGDHAPELCHAMIMRNNRLSATWVGRDVEWSLDTNGQYIVNNSTSRTAQFTAKTAEDFRISQGTAETLDDLALLLGLREYRVLETKGAAQVRQYVRDWRRMLERAQNRWFDYQRHIRWANGPDALRWLGRARSDLQFVIRAMERYEAILIRLGGPQVLFALKSMEDDITQRIARARDAQRRGGGQRGTPRGGGGAIGGS